MGWNGTHPKGCKTCVMCLRPWACKRCVYHYRVFGQFPDVCSRCGTVGDIHLWYDRINNRDCAKFGNLTVFITPELTAKLFDLATGTQFGVHTVPYSEGLWKEVLTTPPKPSRYQRQ